MTNTPPTDRPLTAGDLPWIKPMAEALAGYEADYGEGLDDMHELGRIDESRTTPSFRIRVGHVRALAKILPRPETDESHECEACDGSGKIVEAARTTGANQHSATQMDCEDCDGTGRIEITARPAASAGEGVVSKSDAIRAVDACGGTCSPDEERSGYADGHREALTAALSALAALASPPVSERERELEGALRNLLGAFDTPIARRRLPPTDFSRAAIDQARALTAREEAPAEGAGDLIEAGAKLLWNRFSSSAVEQWADETHKAEYRLAAADLLALHGRTSEPEAGEYVLVEDMEGHNHPRYGEGYFCTPDAIRSAHPAPATADKLRVAKEALEPFALLAPSEVSAGVNMGDPLSKWFTIAQLVAADQALAALNEGGE